MSVQVQNVGQSGLVADVLAASVQATVASQAMVVQHRPDDPMFLDVTITGAIGQLTLGNNIILASAGTGWVDCSAYRAFAIEIVPAAGTVTAGVITFEGSNDGVNVVPIPMYDKAAPAAAPLATVTLVAATNRFLIGNIAFRYVRARISTGITGTTTGVQAFTQLMQNTPSYMIQACRITDGTNVIPTMDAVARKGFQAITDGTNTSAVKAASTPAALTDPALVVTMSGNLPAVTMYSVLALATTNGVSVKATAGRCLAANLTNYSAAIKYVRLFNLAVAPTLGSSTPYLTIPIPATSSIGVEWGTWGLLFGTGIAIAITGAAPDLDATAVAAGDVRVLLSYI